MRQTKYFLAVFALTLTSIQFAHAKGQPGSQQAAQLERQVTINLDYLIYLPKDYEAKQSWPVLLFLHGSGERGDNLELVKVHGPPKLIGGGKHFPFIVVSPQCPKDQRWQAVTVTALLDDIVEKYKADEGRIYVTGLSMGGFGTWALAAHTPHRFAAIVPICGGGETYWTRQLTHLPVWVFHGAKDKAVPLRRSEIMVDALKKKSGNVKLTVYPEAGHDSWTETYDNPKLYEWLLEQKRMARNFTSFKGCELYVWEEDGATYFSLMIGTNRLKSAEEIVKSAVKGFDAVKPKLDQLKKGELVTLHGRRLGEQAPGASAKAAANYCEKIGLKTQ